jgi:hypothetical protein
VVPAGNGMLIWISPYLCRSWISSAARVVYHARSLHNRQ